MDLAQEQILTSAIRQSGSGSTARFQSKGRKASAWAGGLATAASLAAASAVGSDPLVFTPDEYSVGNVGQPDQYVDIVLANGTVVRLPAGHYVISPEGLLVPLIDGTDDPDGDGLTNGQEDTNGNGNWFDDDADGDLVPNFLDSLVPPSDTNEDGLADTLEDPDGSGSVLDDDTDGDNIPNYADDEKLVPNSISSNLVAYELPDLEEAGFSFGGYWSLGALSFAGAGAAAVVINEISRPTFDDVEVTYISEDASDDTGPDTTSGSTVGTLLDIDAYAPGNSTADANITYRITGGNDNGAFKIDADGLITVADAYVIDFEAAASYQLTVNAADQSGRNSSTTVTINVEDVAEVAASAPGTLNHTITEDDVNSQDVALGAIPAQQQWELSNSAQNAGMSIDPNTGDLTLGIIDLENLPSGVTAVSGGGAGDGGSATLTIPITVSTITGETNSFDVTVIVNGIHDEDPDYIGPSPSLSLPENEDGSSGAYAVGSVAGIFDDGEYSPGTAISYSANTFPTGFSIDPATGAITFTGAAYDYEAGPTTESLSVRFTDASTAYTDRTFTVSITDENPVDDDGNPVLVPTLVAPQTVDVSATQHWSTIFDVEMTEGSNDSHDTGITYSIVSGETSDGASFGINSTTGEIYLKCLSDADPPTGSYPFEVVVEAQEIGGDATTHDQSFWIALT